MRTTIKKLSILIALIWAPAVLAQGQVQVEELLRATSSWDGTPYKHYLTGQPEPTLVKITIPAMTTLKWHTHDAINVAYVLSGTLFLEKFGTSEQKVIKAGDSLAEMVGIAHRGYTKEQPVELLVFYATTPGVPLSRPMAK